MDKFESSRPLGKRILRRMYYVMTCPSVTVVARMDVK
jgi:hypothetical protein